MLDICCLPLLKLGLNKFRHPSISYQIGETFLNISIADSNVTPPDYKSRSSEASYGIFTVLYQADI